MTFYSQFDQDRYLEGTIFKGYKNGVFVDVGAHDGVSINNTLYFEQTNNWTGINVEPIKSVYDNLIKNRPTCVNINCAVNNTDGTAEFICNVGYPEMISGLKLEFDPRHMDRLNHELKVCGGHTDIIIVNTKKLETICDEHNIKHINYLSIDVEGAEFEVIKSINFDKVYIDVIGFENNYGDTSIPIIEYLYGKDFLMLQKGADIFMIHKTSKFLPQCTFMYGNWICKNMPIQKSTNLNTGECVYMVEDSVYTKMITESGVAKYYSGPLSLFNANNWNSYTDAGDNYILQKYHS